MAKSKSISKTFVWILMGLLILGLGGFGMTNLSGEVRSIGTVGDKTLPVETYGRMLQQEIRAIETRSGEPLSFQRAQELGVDQSVLQRLVQLRALDDETDRMGLSVGDDILRERIVEIPGFQGIDGSFDREAYRMTLDRTGLSEAQFEAQLREDVARSLLQGAVMGGIAMPATFAHTLMQFIAEERSFTWSLIDGASLTEPLPDPDDSVLRAYYDENIEAFTLPETKKITYAALLPETQLADIEIAEDELQAAYEERSEEFNQPERRLVERLAFIDDDKAAAAAEALAEGSSFEDLVEDRGLQLADIDLGDVSSADLGAAGDTVFATEVGSVAGPLPSPLGPALFRVNAVLPAQVTTFQEAREAIRDDLARDRARRQIAAQAQEFEDMLAGGATLEELDSETGMQLGEIDWSEDTTDGIAAYDGFRSAAAALQAEDFPSIIELEDGGIFAMRLDEVLAPRPAEFETVREAVRAGWEAREIGARLVTMGEEIAGRIREGESFADAGLDAVAETGLTRQATVPGTPPGFVEAVFEMAPGEVRVLPGNGTAAIVKLESVDGTSGNADAEALRAQLQDQADRSLAENVFTRFVAQVTTEARPQIDQRAVQAVHANFR
ncbi:peptidyl-prolyl cis-trans isomerase [Sulfitobacter sp. D35]|uniref:peptidyl-prolyl cis-trans isomerase n=1 Tax=Sulfitobacter sp. D35 TaxID=3083252 RepID=UPI00296EF5B2|nr:peptidyl-prolyl cis-trans isomerase [Sulfitobacter sp. D35]MDW4497545.1 peptidyl-prolyl cis-trans isomerase [Sulfitobacter sp. D35]